MKKTDIIRKITAFLITASLLPAPAYAFDEKAMESDTEDVDAAVFLEQEIPAGLAEITIDAPSAILMEKETGTVIYEKNADERLKPASVTKVMTILLIAEAIEAGTISLDDTVTTSAYAASMGGSQVFLEEGEQMSVHEMLKCMVVSSANDASVAMAEYLAGTEEVFVTRMNERAAELGMTNTHFMNCTGLMDQDKHLTTARDIAIMSRELIKHSWIREYTTIWMDTIRNGEFGLSNTNKLIYYYDGATGLKTGFTSSAGYCLSATAERDGVEYIAAIMNCETSVQRFESAKTLLSYAFANYSLISLNPDEALAPVKVSLGIEDHIQPVLKDAGKLLIEKNRAASVTKETELVPELTAPVKKGQKLGTLRVYAQDETLAEIDIVSDTDVARVSWGRIFISMIKAFFKGDE